MKNGAHANTNNEICGKTADTIDIDKFLFGALALDV